MFLCTTVKCELKLNQFEKLMRFWWIIALNRLIKHFSTGDYSCLNSTWESDKSTQDHGYSTQKGPEVINFFIFYYYFHNAPT